MPTLIVMKMSLSATIKISPETRDALNALKRGGETTDSVIRRLIDRLPTCKLTDCELYKIEGYSIVCGYYHLGVCFREEKTPAALILDIPDIEEVKEE